MSNPHPTICCLNPACQKPDNLDGTKFCVSCGTALTILRSRYYPIKLLSEEGGFGRTYLAQDIDKLEEICVIKQLVPQQQGTAALNKAKQLFEGEAKQLQQLAQNSPIAQQIPQLLAYFLENDYLYLIQQYIEGKTLDKLLQQGCWKEQEVKDFLNSLLPVLEFTHQYKIIHRDIKPSNIIRRNADGKYVLIDFGASKEFCSTVVTKGTVIGTFGYSPIEQLIDGKADPASDLFSLGVTCFYLLTKVDPHELYINDGYRWLEDWEKHLKQPLSQPFRKILAKLLQKERANRYQSAAEVLKDLNYSPSPPPPPPVTPRREILKFFSYVGIGVIAVVLFEFFRGKNPNPKPNPSPGANNPNPSPSPSLSPSPTVTSASVGNLALKPFSFETVQLDSTGNINKRETKQAEAFSADLGNGITLEMVKIPGGSFLMGSPAYEAKRGSDETQHEVTVGDFYIGKYEVTQEQWQAIMGNNPSYFKKGGKYPVESVSWNQCQEFCQKLSQKTGLDFRLPSEAEWEYACRAGTTTPFYFGETLSTDVANYNGNYTYGAGKKGIYQSETKEVGSFPPNAFGLYDMHGNVWEWCQDDYRNTTKIIRGGSWYLDPLYCRSAYRYSYSRDFNDSYVGFRVVGSSPRTS